MLMDFFLAAWVLKFKFDMMKPGGLIVADKGWFSGEKPTGIDAAILGNANPMFGCCSGHISLFSPQAEDEPS